MTTPENVKELRSFLGLVSYLENLLRNFSLKVKSLFELTKPSVTWIWSEECDMAFHTLTDKLVTSPILSNPDVNGGEFILDTDASHCKLSWDYEFVAPPRQDEIGEPVVIAPVNKNNTEVDTSLNVPIKRGRKPNTSKRAKAKEQPDITLTSSLICEMQSQDTELGDLLKLKMDRAVKPTFENFNIKRALFKNWIQKWEHFNCSGDILCYYWENQNGTKRRKICTPKALKGYVLWHLHASPTGGHRTKKQAALCPFFGHT
ncbi:unnamed protein product [Mytilus coruscus]|uniref:Reverse transcriptase/retrotransposon-derived protein RNase H-like domain-containing protein n=1 Tax=Mytilus coruscus TaxID=42192 RepID=A0A6J8CMK0_MYTCO|nr:unnamed protein product [Mytilus coruscus]